MLIFDGKLLAYNEQYIEGQTPAGSLSVDENGVFSYEDNRGGMYGSCEIASGSYSGKFIADSSNSSVLRPAVPIHFRIFVLETSFEFRALFLGDCLE